MNAPPVPDVMPATLLPALALPSVDEPPAVVHRPLLASQDVIDAIRPFWYEGAPAHPGVADNLLARFSAPFDALHIRSALGWMLLQRRDVAWYLLSWLGQRPALDELPSDTLLALYQLLHAMQQAPIHVAADFE